MINFTRMNTTRKKHSAAFKAQVAIEAIKEQETLSELSKRFGIHPQMISTWKREFLSRSSEIFLTKAPDEEAEKREQALYEKIGRLEVEPDGKLSVRRQCELLGGSYGHLSREKSQQVGIGKIHSYKL